MEVWLHLKKHDKIRRKIHDRDSSRAAPLAFTAHAQDAKQDMKAAGRDTKAAAKNTLAAA